MLYNQLYNTFWELRQQERKVRGLALEKGHVAPKVATVLRHGQHERSLGASVQRARACSGRASAAVASFKTRERHQRTREEASARSRATYLSACQKGTRWSSMAAATSVAG